MNVKEWDRLQITNENDNERVTVNSPDDTLERKRTETQKYSIQGKKRKGKFSVKESKESKVLVAARVGQYRELTEPGMASMIVA
ncbi:hypothetical protein BPOR_0321g00050 [Botrytis porri]|uniref:Uncharacterized protein n=1 Tax=Botrytis porri TaxID=87229 RepID=A0A4Z1KLL7_9HELO|nr:hypothetical protein BPOR_0321g00050 [Botrytis porri]